ncbi:helix-turn-helix domain-containing protein [Streptomyces sp. NPDC094438]|uniref:helix-turn-helix domain-containing protein n=1 Tax=Streptomyces sp. NPDC094438 TaxID=3366061 RepID=UPI0038087BBC
MPVALACPIAPTAADRKRLKKMAYGHKTEHRLRLRAQVVLHAARGRSNARVARETGLRLDTVRTWRGRFAEQGLPGLSDRMRLGRPRAFTTLHNAQVTALACRLPAETGVPLSRWSAPELAREAMEHGIAAAYDVHRAKVFGRTEPRTGTDVHEPGRPGHEHRAVRQRQTRVPDRGQRLLPSRAEGR